MDEKPNNEGKATLAYALCTTADVIGGAIGLKTIDAISAFLGATATYLAAHTEPEKLGEAFALAAQMLVEDGKKIEDGIKSGTLPSPTATEDRAEA